MIKFLHYDETNVSCAEFQTFLTYSWHHNARNISSLWRYQLHLHFIVLFMLHIHMHRKYKCYSITPENRNVPRDLVNDDKIVDG